MQKVHFNTKKSIKLKIFIKNRPKYHLALLFLQKVINYILNSIMATLMLASSPWQRCWLSKNKKKLTSKFIIVVVFCFLITTQTFKQTKKKTYKQSRIQKKLNFYKIKCYFTK